MCFSAAKSRLTVAFAIGVPLILHLSFFLAIAYRWIIRGVIAVVSVSEPKAESHFSVYCFTSTARLHRGHPNPLARRALDLSNGKRRRPRAEIHAAEEPQWRDRSSAAYRFHLVRSASPAMSNDDTPNAWPDHSRISRVVVSRFSYSVRHVKPVSMGR